MMIFEFKIDPIPAPRMVHSDTWKKRPCVTKYWRYRNELNRQARRLGFKMPESGYWIKFFLPIPKSASKKLRAAMIGTPHKNTPDLDNMFKGFTDSLCTQDKQIWDGRLSKYWGEEGKIIVEIEA